jgi:hypothetical protein
MNVLGTVCAKEEQLGCAATGYATFTEEKPTEIRSKHRVSRFEGATD